MPLDLQADLPQLALEIVNVPSVSGNETALADALEQSLRSCAHLTVWRNGDALVARTELGHTQRAIIAGHLDTVPVANNLPGRLDSDELIGRGSVDMKAGVAVMAQLAAQLTRPKCDITWVFYDHEEVASNLSGLGRLIRCQPEWLLDADFGVLCEPTGGQIEVGCNGSLRVALQTAGRRAHTARAWMGDNAIHRMAPHLLRLAELVMPTVTVNNFAYRESLQAVGVQGGVAGNVVPDTCTAQINYRFAPDKTPDQALTQLLAYLFPNELVDFGNDLSIGQKISLSSAVSLVVEDIASPAKPSLDSPLAQGLLDAVAAAGLPAPQAKLGWTDVARLAAAGIPAVNFGPGDPTLAHTDDEHCPVAQIRQTAAILAEVLGGA